ncbi:MAG: nitrate reductase molybdenum cofactor assembly chaperone [Chloroflexi bacterium]|nr:nitrate reductase molybdenum cofactor assembly chaperone [Chloroflexota bacterium]
MVDLKEICRQFAGILEYPQRDLAERASECEALVAPVDAEAKASLGEFRAFVEKTPLGQMEEIYTGTFDLNATCHLYVGDYILGQDYKRSAFLNKLLEIYQECGFDPGREMPDHLVVLLRFVATCDRAEISEEIARDAVLPAVEQMLAKKEKGKKNWGTLVTVQPYTLVLKALRLALQPQPVAAKEG